MERERKPVGKSKIGGVATRQLSLEEYIKYQFGYNFIMPVTLFSFPCKQKLKYYCVNQR